MSVNTWDFDNNNKKKEFTKLPEGVTKVRFIDSTPNVRWTHWMPASTLKGVTGKGKSITCPGKGCPICEIRKVQKNNKQEPTYGMSRRISMQVLNRNTGNLEILEQGITFYEDLKDVMSILQEQGKQLIDLDLTIRRRGMDKNTTYRIDTGDEYELTDKDKKLIEEQIDLKEYFVPNTIEQITRVINGEEWDEVMFPKKDESEGEVEEEIEIE